MPFPARINKYGMPKFIQKNFKNNLEIDSTIINQNKEEERERDNK